MNSFIKSLKRLIKRTLQSVGLFKEIDRDAVPLPSPEECEKRIFADFDPTLVLDVGAAIGNYGAGLRADGYKNRICSFEPRTEAMPRLLAKAAGDPLWECHPFALGAEESSATIQIANNKYSSSILPIDDLAVRVEAHTRTVGAEEIQVRTLDSLWPELAPKPDDRILLKIDVQGFEAAVLEGAKHSLPYIDAIHVELSLQQLYHGAPLAEELMGKLRALGYSPVSMNTAFLDRKTARLLQVDAIFLRLDRVDSRG